MEAELITNWPNNNNKYKQVLLSLHETSKLTEKNSEMERQN